MTVQEPRPAVHDAPALNGRVVAPVPPDAPDASPPRYRARRRIAFIINQLTYGGAETQVSLLARGMARRGWQVEVVTIREPEALVEELEAGGVTMRTKHITWGTPAWFGSPWLIRTLRRFRPHVVHSHMYRPNIWARLLRPAVRPPVLVCTAHNTTENDTYSDEAGRAELLYRLTDRLCDLTTNVSRVAVDRYARLGAAPAHRLRLVGNGIDTERFRPDPAARERLRTELGLADARVILAIGRIEEQKNYPLLLHAFRELADQRSDLRLLIVGEGHDEDEVQALASELQLDAFVRFLGLRDDVPDLMNAADVYVMSSTWEGLPIVLLEASATGLPVVATDVGGNADIVEDGVTGFLVPRGDRTALVDALSRMLALPEAERRRMGAAARAHVEEHFGIERVLDRWEAIYDELLERPPSLVERLLGRGRVHPRVLTDSNMWQSPTWTREVDTVYRLQSRSRLVNHPITLTLRLFAQGWRYETVVTTGNKGSLAYGLLCRLTFRRQRQVMTQLYLDPPRGMLRPVQDALMRLMLRGVHGVLIPSRGEAPVVTQRFGVPADRIRYVPFHTNVIEPEDLGCASGPVFAGGRNFRDYETLIEAVRGTGIELVIVCGQDQLRDVAIPDHVTVHRELPFAEYLALMRESCAVVVPLTNASVPSGQSSILEGMAYGKPVITTDAIGTVDYVRHGLDGLLYRPGDVEELRAHLVALTSDEPRRRRMGRAAYEHVMRSFTFEIHAAAKLHAIDELVESGRARG